MTLPCIGVTGMGVISALGHNVDETMTALAQGLSGLRPLSRFAPPHSPLPVGEISLEPSDKGLPATHLFARHAADQAMANCPQGPDAIVLGSTTGGMAVTEILLKANCNDPEAYQKHAIGSVAEDLARRYDCNGPVISVSTACSSGAGAIALAMAMIRSGRYQRILAGGVDALCHMTYYGFKSLQLIDPQGSRPMDETRRGMSVAEGAGMLLIESNPADGAAIYLLGAGLSCDAHHPAQPHPEGRGALAAMQSALADAKCSSDQIDYINLHGTGTTDNDRAEARAIRTLFEPQLPLISSIKGATGHSLAASGAIEAVVAARAIETPLVPANTGCQTPDPELGVTPVSQPTKKKINTVLSNSFGFGGNNATLVIGNTPESTVARSPLPPLGIMGWAAITGAGTTSATFDQITKGEDCRGMLDAKQLSQGLPPQMIRRLKRLPLITLSLAAGAIEKAGDTAPQSVYFGTGWGALSETHDFLKGLYESGEKFPSPIDFIGSVHNAPAGQVALLTGATGANVTLSGGDSSFEQALFGAQLLGGRDPLMVLGADESHPKLSPLFDPSVTDDTLLADGGGALMLHRTSQPGVPLVDLKCYETGHSDALDLQRMITDLGGPDQIGQRYGLVLAGIPAAQRALGERQIAQFTSETGYGGPVIDYRKFIGEFAAASAVATVYAAAWVKENLDKGVSSQGALVIGLGEALTAIEVAPS